MSFLDCQAFEHKRSNSSEEKPGPSPSEKWAAERSPLVQSLNW